MAQPRPSVVTEFGWLGFFLLIFAAFVYAFVGLLVPHHFNDKVAIVLAAIFAGLLMIVTRAWMTRRFGRR